MTMLLLVPAAGRAQDFTWRGRLAEGRTLEIHGVNGGIDAVRARGTEILVTADKRARRSDPDDVTIEVVEHAGGVTICAVYPTRATRQPNECRPGGGRNNVQDNDVTVDFTVHVPAGVMLEAHTVNGDIDVADLESNVDARTVNGGIDISTSGWARASTVNGSITAVMGRADWPGGAEFETVNGGIRLTLPADVAADLTASTVNGDIDTDFPVTVQGRWGPRRISGTLGGGGRDLRLKTVNGGITLRKR
jgi:hypothetical protein